ncbi:MAG: hypothetical protein JO057_21810, partial [Chloroflexi bacterium]|nr:hypothetical protein [Chloroflexota bacterium]
MVTTQSAATIVAPVIGGHEADLQQLLQTAGENPAANSLVPFGNFPNVHFARFFILPSATDSQGHTFASELVFLADVDGPGEAFVRQMIGAAGNGLHSVFQHCEGYSGRAGLQDYVCRHAVTAAASYVNTVGRTVRQVRQEAQLYDAIRQFLDSNQRTFRFADARRVRAAVQEFVERDPALAWARQPA